MALQTPHSGYHWDGSDRPFFEGWYTRLTLPDLAQSFAFMYSIQNPAGGTRASGGCAQILGPDDTYVCRTFPNTAGFWAWHDCVGVGHWRSPVDSLRPVWLAPQRFATTVAEGYQLTATQHQGQLYDPASGRWTRWCYRLRPVYGWGTPTRPQQSTAGWFSRFQLFEPGWQVLMAHGVATGWIEWHGQRYEFTDAPVYAEKNWGGAFPEQWFWMQCNSFIDQPALTLTAVGSYRRIFTWQETVGMIGLHYQGRFYEFTPWTAKISWAVHPWGRWWIGAETDRYNVALTGWCERSPAQVRVPGQAGMKFNCRDTANGNLTLQLWDIQTNSSQPPILTAHSNLAALEVGGKSWTTPWATANYSPASQPDFSTLSKAKAR